MVTILKYITAFILGGFLLTSCDNTTSLQEYLVEKQEDNNFVKADLATSLFFSEEDKLTKEQKEVLKSVKKVNVVAYPVKDNEAEYTLEYKNIQEILSQERYQTLTKAKHKNWDLTLKYLGEEEAVDEVIVLVNDDKKGFAVIRLIGDDMKPGDMYKTFLDMDKDNIDLSALKTIEKLF